MLDFLNLKRITRSSGIRYILLLLSKFFMFRSFSNQIFGNKCVAIISKSSKFHILKLKVFFLLKLR